MLVYSIKIITLPVTLPFIALYCGVSSVWSHIRSKVPFVKTYYSGGPLELSVSLLGEVYLLNEGSVVEATDADPVPFRNVIESIRLTKSLPRGVWAIPLDPRLGDILLKNGFTRLGSTYVKTR